MSIQFGALEYSKRFFAAQNVRNGRGGPDGMVLGSGQLFIAGVFAGLANGVVSGPVEHIRIREQTFSSLSFVPNLVPSFQSPRLISPLPRIRSRAAEFNIRRTCRALPLSR